MKHTFYTMLLLGTLVACQADKEQNSSSEPNNKENTETSSNTESDESSSQETETPSLVINTEFGEARWYYGTLDKYPIWLYVSDMYESPTTKGTFHVSASYGYDSQKGAAIDISGKITNGNFSLTELTKQQEKFEGKLNENTGELSGNWTMGNKKMAFSLMPVSTIPQNNQEFIDAFADNTGIEQINNISVYNVSYKLYYKEKKFDTYIPNLKKFITKLNMEGEDGVLLSKEKISNDRWLAFFTYHATEAVYSPDEQTEDNRGVALIDAKGSVLDAVQLGNYGFYVDFTMTLNNQKQIVTTVEQLGRAMNPETGMNATMVMGSVEKTYAVKNDKIVLINTKTDGDVL